MFASRQVKMHTVEGLEDKGEGGLGLSHKLLGELQFLFYVNMSSAKRIEADILEFAAPVIGEVISGRKSFKSAAKSVGKQTLNKTVG